MRALRTALLVGLATTFAAGPALAHVGMTATSGFMAGFGHPFGGLDHILAMVLVGVLAWRIGGKALILLPLAFVGLMLAGGGLAIAGIHLPYVELGIAASIIVLGLAVALSIRAPAVMAALVVGAFAVFHGWAHGAEMHQGIDGQAYGVGFAAATALLHIAGIGLAAGVAARLGRSGDVALRILAAGSAAVGLALAAGLA